MSPILGPYPREAILLARSYLRSLGYDGGNRQTVASAESCNSPLWQMAIEAHLTAEQLATATARAITLIAMAQTPEGRRAISELGAVAAVASPPSIQAAA